MKKWIAVLTLPALALGMLWIGKAVIADQGAMPEEAMPEEAQNLTEKKEAPDVLNFTMKNLVGEDVELAKYAGKVVLMVNVASNCGYTKQYAGLQGLHKKYSEQGLSILGFPTNDFGGQEPGTEAEIGAFCKKNYGVEFDMFSKIKVKGEGKAPLYDYLTSEKTDPKFPGEVGWNFEKFLIGRNGEIVARFKSGVPPDAPELIKAVEAELARK